MKGAAPAVTLNLLGGRNISSAITGGIAPAMTLNLWDHREEPAPNPAPPTSRRGPG